MDVPVQKGPIEVPMTSKEKPYREKRKETAEKVNKRQEGKTLKYVKTCSKRY
jgi:hypothetical protein